MVIAMRDAGKYRMPVTFRRYLKFLASSKINDNNGIAEGAPL